MLGKQPLSTAGLGHARGAAGWRAGPSRAGDAGGGKKDVQGRTRRVCSRPLGAGAAVERDRVGSMPLGEHARPRAAFRHQAWLCEEDGKWRKKRERIKGIMVLYYFFSFKKLFYQTG